MLYRPLYPDEYVQLKPVFDAYGSATPVPEMSLIVAAIERGKVEGFLVFQPVWHLEPIHITQEARDRVSCKALVKEAEKHIPKGTTYYSFIPADGRLEGLARVTGFEEQPWKIFRKVS